MPEAIESKPITKEQFLADPKQLKLAVLLNGNFGVGKTYTAMTFPKWAYAMFEPHGMATAMTNKPLLDNMVHYESFVPKNTEDIATTFARFSKYLAKCRVDAEAGIIETVIIDNLSHLMENRWIYIEKYEPAISKGGEVNKLAMFLGLARWAYRMTVLDFLTIPCHRVMTCHEMEETEGQDGQRVKTGQVLSKTLGGFRDDVAGLFNASLYLECLKTGVNTYKYQVRCRPGQGKRAKNNLGLPEIVENISYTTLVKALNAHTSPAVSHPATAN